LERRRNFAVIGLGSFGSTVAAELARFGNHVLGIDTSEKCVARIADVIAEAVIADARDETALREAGLEECDVAVIAMGGDLEANVLATMNAKLIGVKTIWAKAANKTQHRILLKLGAERVVLPEMEMGQHIAQMLNNPAVRDYVSLGNGFHVVNMAAPSWMDGKAIGSLKLAEKYELRCLGIMRGSDYVDVTDPATPLRTEDRMLMLGRRPALRAFGDTL
jgi:trk system potassium uptake protein TrkA